MELYHNGYSYGIKSIIHVYFLPPPSHKPTQITHGNKISCTVYWNGLVYGLRVRAVNPCCKILTTESLVLGITVWLWNCCILLNMEKKKALEIRKRCHCRTPDLPKVKNRNDDKIALLVQHACILSNSSWARVSRMCALSSFQEHQQIIFAWASGSCGCGIVSYCALGFL